LKLFFDSSVLVAVFYADHPDHAPSERAFLSGRKEDLFCALRTLGEVYAVLTGLPLRPRITGAEGVDIIRQIRNRLTLVSLTEDEYVATIESASAAIVGGAVYDALIARCAVKAQADVLLTWNQRDFSRFGDAVARLAKTPQEFQADAQRCNP
jgi:predicted nucleic acid-binding protein